jgi:hypothetical protein
VPKSSPPRAYSLEPSGSSNGLKSKAPPGSTVPPYRVQDGVDDAMRMAPDWLIVGEVRTGQAALSLFRAQMSDHPGLCTFHAEGAEAAVHRMSVKEAGCSLPGLSIVLWEIIVDFRVALSASRNLWHGRRCLLLNRRCIPLRDVHRPAHQAIIHLHLLTSVSALVRSQAGM